MKRRLFAITIILSMLLAFVVIMTEIEADARADLLILASTVSSSTNPGTNPVTLTLTFTNIGSVPVEDIWVTMSGFSTSTATLESGEFTRRLDDVGGDTAVPIPPAADTRQLSPGQNGVVTYTIFVNPVFGTGVLPLTIDINYTDGTKNYTGSFPVGANIIRPVPPEEPEPEPPAPPPTELPLSVPRVIISRHALSVDTVYVGQPFYLTITLLNTSRSMNVKNMQVTFTDSGGTFFPVAGVDSFFIERLDKQETAELTIQLIARPPSNSERTSHAVTVKIEYEDTKNNSHSTAPTVSIPVFTQIRLVTDNVTFEDEGDGTAFLMFQAINKGLAPLNNVNIRLEGPLAAAEGNFFVGTMAPGAVEFFEDSIIVFEFGEVRGEIIIEFEDSSGTPGEIRVPIAAFVSEPFFPEPDFSGDEMWQIPGEDIWYDEDPGTTGSLSSLLWWHWALIIGGSILVVGVITIGIVRRVKRKKREAEDFSD